MIGNIVDFVTGHNDPDAQNGDLNQMVDTEGLVCDISGYGAIDRMNDDIHMNEMERRVSRYLERIKQAHSKGEFRRIAKETKSGEKASSWDQVHQASIHNRHVYFAGMPLSLSKEIVQIKRNERLIVRRAEELVQDVRKRDEQIDGLLKKQNVDFLKYEVAMGKAMGLGMGSSLIAGVIKRIIDRQRRFFFLTARSVHVKELQQSLASQTKSIRKKNKLASLVIARGIQNMIRSHLKDALFHLKNAKSALPLRDSFTSMNYLKQFHHGAPPVKHTTLKQKGKSEGKHNKGSENVEESLLTRLENLVAEEMEILTSKRSIL